VNQNDPEKPFFGLRRYLPFDMSQTVGHRNRSVITRLVDGWHAWKSRPKGRKPNA
jgi:hypothetical protein